MLKGLQITALALTLASFVVIISTEIAYAKQSTGNTVDIVGDSKGTAERRCTPGPRTACPVKNPKGDTPGSPVDKTTPTPPIPITRPELIDVTSTVAIEKLEALKALGQATNDDYILLGYFYSLEKKYDLSEANYLTALKLATDDGRKAIIEQELKKVRAAMGEVK